MGSDGYLGFGFAAIPNRAVKSLTDIGTLN